MLIQYAASHWCFSSMVEQNKKEKFNESSVKVLET